jgi:hypothetical protein
LFAVSTDTTTSTAGCKSLRVTNEVRVSGKLKYISCGEYGHWGVNKANLIYFREGVSRSNPVGTKWRRIPGKLTQLEAGQYGQVWGVNKRGWVYVRTGVTEQVPWGRGWKRVKTKKAWSRITIGVGTVYGVAKHGQVYRTIPATGGVSPRPPAKGMFA